MLSVRFLGGLMVATGISWWGMSEAKKLKDRVEFLKAVLSGLTRTKTEMEFGRFDIGYIFRKLNIKGDRNIFSLCAEHIKTEGIRSAWKKSVNSVCDNGIIKEDEKNVISQLGNSLGMSDIEGQKDNIDMVVTELKKCITLAEDENIRLGKVYRGCGILLGVFIMIILI